MDINISWIQTIILILGFGVTVWSIYKNTEARKTELFHDMAKEERDLQIKLTEITRELKKEEEQGSTKIEELKLLKKIIIKQHLNFFEHLALLINEKKINKNMTMKYFKALFKDATKKYEEYIFPDYTQIIKLSNEMGWDDKMSINTNDREIKDKINKIHEEVKNISSNSKFSILGIGLAYLAIALTLISPDIYGGMANIAKGLLSLLCWVAGFFYILLFVKKSFT